MKKNVRVFAPGTVANMGCGFDVMGMTLNGVGDIVSVSVGEGDGLSIENKSGVELPEELDKNVITPAVRALMTEFGEPRMVEITVEHKLLPYMLSMRRLDVLLIPRSSWNSQWKERSLSAVVRLMRIM